METRRNLGYRSDYRKLVVPILTRYRLSIDEVKSDSHFRTLVSCRREIACALRKAGWSLQEIGILIDRHHSSVLNLITPKRQTGPIPCPDLSGEWAI